jgi:hypothetical protein
MVVRMAVRVLCTILRRRIISTSRPSSVARQPEPWRLAACVVRRFDEPPAIALKGFGYLP